MILAGFSEHYLLKCYFRRDLPYIDYKGLTVLLPIPKDISIELEVMHIVSFSFLIYEEYQISTSVDYIVCAGDT